MTDPTQQPPPAPPVSQLDVTEVIDDLTAVHDGLRDALPIILQAGMRVPCWPDSFLLDVAETVAEAIGRLEAAVGLLSPRPSTPD